jgi:hypothetical protein
MRTEISFKIQPISNKGLDYFENYSDGSTERYAFGVDRKRGLYVIYVPPGKGQNFEPSWTDEEERRIAPRLVAYVTQPGCFGLPNRTKVEFRRRD